MNGNRRRFLQLLGGAGVAAAGLGRLAPVHSADEPLATTDLGNGLVQITGAGGNIVVLPTADGIVMVDSGTAASSQRVLELITKELGGGANVGAEFEEDWTLGRNDGQDDSTG